MAMPGERVVVAAGVYREQVSPARGGTGPGRMISYEAAPGADVIIKGSALVTDWRPSEGWNFGEVADDARFVQATQKHMGDGTGIGTFNDRIRDAVRGGRRKSFSHVGEGFILD